VSMSWFSCFVLEIIFRHVSAITSIGFVHFWNPFYLCNFHAYDNLNNFQSSLCLFLSPIIVV
jgi:hypothetical protein